MSSFVMLPDDKEDMDEMLLLLLVLLLSYSTNAVFIALTIATAFLRSAELFQQNNNIVNKYSNDTMNQETKMGAPNFLVADSFLIYPIRMQIVQRWRKWRRKLQQNPKIQVLPQLSPAKFPGELAGENVYRISLLSLLLSSAYFQLVRTGPIFQTPCCAQKKNNDDDNLPFNEIHRGTTKPVNRFSCLK